MTNEEFIKKVSYLITAYEVYDSENMFMEWEDPSHQEYLKELVCKLIDINHAYEDERIKWEEKEERKHTPVLKNDDARKFLEKLRVTEEITLKRKDEYSEKIRKTMEFLEEKEKNKKDTD